MRLKSVWLIASMALSLTMIAAQTRARTSQLVPPDAAAVSFYQWYLDALDKHMVPTDDLRGPIQQRISFNLVRRLQRLLRNGDMEEDYFLKAQDFLPDWKTSVHAKPAQIKGVSAITEVTLGAGSSEHDLKVTLVQHGRIWKIDSVSAISGPSKSP